MSIVSTRRYRASSIAKVYDNVADDYEATKTNVFNVKYKEPAFWRSLGDVQGKAVLDLACGAGPFTRKIKEKGASQVVGVDISQRMIALALGHELDNRLGIDYHVGDAASWRYGQGNNAIFDIVTAHYLLCYAKDKIQLQNFCDAAFAHTKPNGKFTTMVTVYCDAICTQGDSPINGYFYEPRDLLNENEWYEGMQVDITIFSSDMQRKCTFYNYAWLPSTIKSALMDAGFQFIEEEHVSESNPMHIFTAYKA